MTNHQEFALHASLVGMIEFFLMPGVVYWHTPNEANRSRKQNPRTGKWYSPEGQRLKQLGMRAGVSDLCFCAPPNGRLMVLELKKPGEKPSKEQRKFMDDIIAAGGLADWADNIDDATRILREWGVLRQQKVGLR